MREQMLFPDMKPSVKTRSQECRSTFGKCEFAVDILMGQGKTEQQARRVIGGWIKRAGGSQPVIDAIEAARKVDALDFIGYVFGCLSSRTSQQDRHRAAAGAVSSMLRKKNG